MINIQDQALSQAVPLEGGRTFAERFVSVQGTVVAATGSAVYLMVATPLEDQVRLCARARGSRWLVLCCWCRALLLPAFCCHPHVCLPTLSPSLPPALP